MKQKTIKEIEEFIFSEKGITNSEFEELKNDSRKGVLALIKKWENQQKLNELSKEQFYKMMVFENECRKNGYTYITGIDEVGRGPLAGPVVAAAVILPAGFYLPGINDSKKLSEKLRDEFYEVIKEKSIAIGIGVVTAKEIDEINIYEATKKAMVKAIHSLSIKPDMLLIDAMKLPINIPQQKIIKGDSKSVTIAASSIIAKVTRDRYMKELGEKFSQYGFERHMGYGTKEHLEAIQTHGIIAEHRCSFAPIKSNEMLLG